MLLVWEDPEIVWPQGRFAGAASIALKAGDSLHLSSDWPAMEVVAQTFLQRPGYQCRGGRLLFKGEPLPAVGAGPVIKKGLWWCDPLKRPAYIGSVTFKQYLYNWYRLLFREDMSHKTFNESAQQVSQKIGLPVEKWQEAMAGWQGDDWIRAELLQMEMVKPQLVLLKQSVAALPLVAETIEALKVSVVLGAA